MGVAFSYIFIAARRRAGQHQPAAVGLVGDWLDRHVSYQINLGIFGLAAVFAPSMQVLIWLRLLMGLGAEIVVGYSTMAEFIPSAYRGRWVGLPSLFTNPV
jgi:putative MFS transporter